MVELGWHMGGRRCAFHWQVFSLHPIMPTKNSDSSYDIPGLKRT